MTHPHTTLNSKINKVEKEMPSIIDLATTTAINTKINEVKYEMLKITNLTTTTTLTAVENRIPNVTEKLVKLKKKITADHDHGKYITTQEFNKLAAEHFTARLAQANLESKSDIANFVKKTDFDDKLKNISIKNELNELSEKVQVISTKGLTKDLINKISIHNGAKYFSSGVFQTYLVFVPAKKYIKYFSGTTRIDSWKSKKISEENIKNITNQIAFLHQLLLIIMYYQI